MTSAHGGGHAGVSRERVSYRPSSRVERAGREALYSRGKRREIGDESLLHNATAFSLRRRAGGRAWAVAV